MINRSDRPAVSTSLGWMPALGVTLAALYPAANGVYWAVPLTGAAVWGAIGIWRAVNLLGLIHGHQRWRDIEVPAADDMPEATR